jgi:hypothetical protein
VLPQATGEKVATGYCNWFDGCHSLLPILARGLPQALAIGWRVFQRLFLLARKSLPKYANPSNLLKLTEKLKLLLATAYFKEIYK